MLSDDEFCYFDEYDYDSHDDDDDYEDYFDDDDHCIYMSGSCYDNDDMDDEDILSMVEISRKANQKSDPDQIDRKLVYKELDLQDPTELLKSPQSLMDICSRKVALYFPFAYIEDRDPPIPDNIQLKVMKQSFPQSMEKIKRYCVLNNGSSTEFDRAIRILKTVKDTKQIGFHLSASIETSGYRSEMLYRPPGKKAPNLYVTIKFDRGMITEMNCPCESSSSWCSHVIAVCLVRIFKHDDCVYKPPLSDSLNNLKSYAQLRTFTQYLIAEFSDGRIVESAQNVLDRMLTPRSDENDAIDQIWGAPDPTAGPGIDELSHWLVCEEGLKSRCVTLIHNSDISEGCWGLNIAEVGQTSSVMEWWRTFQLDKPIVDGYFCEFSDPASAGNAQFSYNYYRHSYSREKSQEIAKFLKTCEDILKDDFSYSLKAVQTFTTKLLDAIKEKNQREHYRYDKKVFESNSHLGCIPRPQQCWLFRDQLARLWRLLVLNPSITDRKREEIFATLVELTTMTQNNTGKEKGLPKKEYLQWDSPKHIFQLKNFSWKNLELGSGPFRNATLAEVKITDCVVMETQRYTPLDAPIEDVTDHFSYPVLLTCGSFSSSVTVFCYMIEALVVYGDTEQAVHLAMALALAIVRYYSAWLEGKLRVNVKETVYVNWDEDEAAKDSGSGKRGKKPKRGAGRKRGRKGGKKAEIEILGKQHLRDMVFHEETGIIPVTCLAYLLHVLETNVDMVGEMLKLVKVQSREDTDVDMDCGDDFTSDARSLIFRLGVVSLAMPKVQAPSLQLQVEWFNWETYIADKMAKATVTDVDLIFLQQMTARLIGLSVIRYSPSSYLPPYTLIMTLFNHMYKPNATGKVSEACAEVLTVALETVEAPTPACGTSIHKRLFFESCRRHWVKLAETVLYGASVHADHLKKALQSVFKSASMIGSPEDEIAITARASGSKKISHNEQKTAFIHHMLPEKVIAALYLSHSLVERSDKIRLSEVSTSAAKPVASLPGVSPAKLERKTFETLMVDGRKMLVKEQPVSDQRRLLYESAIKIGTYAYAVKNNAFHKLKLESYSIEYNFPEFLQRNLRWLCRLSTKIHAKAFELILELQRKSSYPVRCFTDDEVLRLCTQMLESEQKRDARVWVMVREAFIALMKDDNFKKVNGILQLCRAVEKEVATSRALLFPAVCKDILVRVPASTLTQTLKFDHLTQATKLMQKLFKDLEIDDHDVLNSLKELFAERSVEYEKPGTSSSDKPGTSKNLPRLPLDEHLKLSFELALEAVGQIVENDTIRGYESRRRFESLCDVVTFVAEKACATEANPLGDPIRKNGHDYPDFEEVYVSRFVEVLCNTIKDCLLLTDFFFEIASRLLVLPQHGSFGRDKVLLSDDNKVDVLCKSCTSLSVLLQRCITGLLEAIQGDTMKSFLKVKVKDAPQDARSRLKSVAKHDRFYYNSSLVAVLEVLKRLMNLTEDDREDFDSLSYKLAAKNALLKTAIEELNSKGSSNSPRPHEVVPEELISSLLLRRMFSPALAGFDYDSDDWRTPF